MPRKPQTPNYYSEWYRINRERLLPIRRAYNKKYTARPAHKEKARLYNARPEIKLARKKYKATPEGKAAEKRYRRKNWPKILQVSYKRHLQSRYGLSPAEYDKLVKEQSGKCAICQIFKGKKLVVDHSHVTGRVRGLLCHSCNLALGLLKDNVNVLAEAIKYLMK